MGFWIRDDVSKLMDKIIKSILDNTIIINSSSKFNQHADLEH
jgi:hypothetical protein